MQQPQKLRFVLLFLPNLFHFLLPLVRLSEQTTESQVKIQWAYLNISIKCSSDRGNGGGGGGSGQAFVACGSTLAQ